MPSLTRCLAPLDQRIQTVCGRYAMRKPWRSLDSLPHGGLLLDGRSPIQRQLKVNLWLVVGVNVNIAAGRRFECAADTGHLIIHVRANDEGRRCGPSAISIA